MTVLYRAMSHIDGWPHRNGLFNGVRVTWLAWERPEPIASWAELLDGNYDDPYAQGLADELFTPDEARQLTCYLKTHDVDLMLIAELLPIATRTPDGALLMPLSAMPAGGDTDFHLLYEEPGYDLPFKVSGYFNIEPDQMLVKQRCPHTCPDHSEAPYREVGWKPDGWDAA